MTGKTHQRRNPITRAWTLSRRSRTSRPSALAALIFLTAAWAYGTVIEKPIRLDSQTGGPQSLCVAATGSGHIAAAWIVAHGADRGIYVRERVSLIWEPAQRIALPEQAQPRDLDLAFDAKERLHLAWTAMAGDGGTRKLYHLRNDGSASGLGIECLNELFADESPGNADFPSLTADAAGGVYVVWQESRSMRYSIRAAHQKDPNDWFDLGRVSGISLSGMAPQFFNIDPLEVAWYEVLEVGSELRIEQWSEADNRWRPSNIEREIRLLPRDRQVIVRSTPLGPVACWNEPNQDGRTSIDLGLIPPSALDGLTGMIHDQLTEPDGEQANPNLSGQLPGRMTVAWNAFTGARQSVCLASVFNPAKDPEIVTVSPASQRFAARADHVTVGDWSGLVWTDEAGDGGEGGVYFGEVSWTATP